MSCVPNFRKGEKVHTATTESSPRSFTQSKSKIKLQTENNWLRKKDLFLFLIIYMRVCVFCLWVCAHECRCPQRLAEGFRALGAEVTGGCDVFDRGVGN